MPATPTDRLYGLTTSVAVKPPCRVATTAAITLSGLQTIDGVVLEEDDRVLVMDQTDESDNGIYVASISGWSRAPDFDGPRDAVNGTLLSVREGNTYGSTSWQVTSDDPVVIGVDDITFQQAVLEDSATAAFIQAGTGAVVRTAQAKMRENASPEDFGAKADGSDDLLELQRLRLLTTFVELGADKTYTLSAALEMGGGYIKGKSQSVLNGPLKFTNASHFYTFGADNLTVDGTGTSGQTGLVVTKGHRGQFHNLLVQNFDKAGTLSESWTQDYFGLSAVLCDAGFEILENCNAVTLWGGNLTDNTGYNLKIRGCVNTGKSGGTVESATGYGVVVDQDGAFLGGAECRNCFLDNVYFENNTLGHVKLGTGAQATGVIRTFRITNPYMLPAPFGIDAAHTDELLIENFNFNIPFSTAAIILRDTSKRTRITRLPRNSLVVPALITVEAGATVAHDTVQWDIGGTFTLDGAGEGYDDITWALPYDVTVTRPPIRVQIYAVGSDPSGGVTVQANLLTGNSARLRFKGVAGTAFGYGWFTGEHGASA